MVLDARIVDVHEGRRAVALAGSMKGKHWLRALLEHLALAATLGVGARTRMFWLGIARDGTLELATGDMPLLAQDAAAARSEEHTSELQSLMRISYAVFCLKKKKNKKTTNSTEKQPKKTL